MWDRKMWGLKIVFGCSAVLIYCQLDLTKKHQWNLDQKKNFIQNNAFQNVVSKKVKYCSSVIVLTHLPLMLHIFVSEKGQHWLR